MDMEGCMTSMDSPARNTVDAYVKDVYFYGMTSGERRGRWKTS